MNLKYKILVGVGVVALIVGVIFVVVGKKNETYKEKELISNVVDAGGSGTRLNVYKYTDKLRQTTIECEGKGLGNYKESEFPELSRKLDECYKKGHEYIPEGAITPIWFAATAGMRLLRLRDLPRSTKIWTLVNATLSRTDYKVMWSNTFPGNYEARFSWIAANLLKKTLKAGSQVGIAETGSSSIQIAFPVNEEPSDDNHVTLLTIDNENTTLYEYSYLCYGEAEILRRTHAQLISDSSFSKNGEDPCTNSGYHWTLTSDYLWSVPCVTGDYAKEHFGYDLPGPGGNATSYNLTGSGKPTECLNLLKKMIPTNCTKNKPCAMDDVFQPKVHGKYLALSSFFYATDYMGLPYNGKRAEYWQKTVELCNTTYDKLSPKYADTPEKFKSKQCFDSIFTYFLLDEGFKFNDGNWDIEYTDKIDGNGVQWTLGVAYQYLPISYVHYIDVERKKYKAMFVVGIVLIVAAVVLTIIGGIGWKKSESYESIQ